MLAGKSSVQRCKQLLADTFVAQVWFPTDSLLASGVWVGNTLALQLQGLDSIPEGDIIHFNITITMALGCIEHHFRKLNK